MGDSRRQDSFPSDPGRSGAQPFLFLRTKLLPPRAVPELVARPRLTRKLLDNLANPLSLVTANAGSGKTTLVADFIREHADRFVWYQLDRTDSDPFLFLGYITHGIKQVVPGFGEITLSYLGQSAEELTRQPERAVDVLLNEIVDNIEQKLVLVLDDYHHLGTDTMVHRMVDRLLAYLPDVMHVIIVSRELPMLSLARLRSQGRIEIVDRGDLLFTDDETHELFRMVFDLEMTTEELTAYREHTEGWITGLQLVRQRAERSALAGGVEEQSALDLLEALRKSEQDVFDYFAEEVFAEEPDEVKSLLMNVSLLERLDMRLCVQLYPGFDCRSILPALVRRNLFITVASDGRGEEYRLHPLFQSFLRRRLRLQTGRAGMNAEFARYAEYFLALNQLEPAVSYLLRGEEFEEAAEVISAFGGAWLASGALSSLYAFAEALPVTIVERHPRVLSYQAEVLRVRGDYDAAQAMLRRATTLLHEVGDSEGEAEALHGLASIARRRGDHDGALSLLDLAEALVSEGDSVRTKCGNTRGLCLMALGDLNAAESEFRAALHEAEEQGDEAYLRVIAHNLGLPSMLRGDFGEALRWLKRMLPAEQGATPMPRDATAHLNVARCHLFRGDLALCEKHLAAAMECSQIFNLTSLLGEIFEAYGNLRRETGDYERAAEFYERARRAYEDAGIDQSQRELPEEQAMLHLQAGDSTTARSQIEQLISARKTSGNEFGVHTASLARGHVLIASGELDGAEADLRSACDYFRKCGLHYYEAEASIALAVCAGRRDAEGELLGNLRRAIDLAACYDYEYWLQREVAANSGLFETPEAIALLPGELRDQLGRVPVRPPAARVVSTGAPMTDLTINMLGHPEVFRDRAHPLTGEVWTTRRARDILCFIASRPHRRAAKEVIMETFWAEADPAVVEKNFHPTISHIRKGLNSNHAFKQNFLIYRDGDYQLNSEFAYQIDTVEFDRHMVEAENAKRVRDSETCELSLNRAASLYRGEFMRGCYDSWAEDQRTYYRQQHLSILETLADIKERAGDWVSALQLVQKILSDDPYREDIHCRAMRAQAALGNRVAIKDQFESLRRVLQKELGVEPSAETRKLYNELIK